MESNIRKWIAQIAALGQYRKSGLIKNILSMSLIQGVNYLIPFLTIPYIARVVSTGNFGLLSYAQTVVAYTTLLINFSFDYTITREIAIRKDNLKAVSRTFSAVIYAKLLLFVVTSIFYFGLIAYFDKFSKDYELYFYTYLVNVGFIFFPTWLYQGMGKLTFLAGFNFVIKVIFALSIFLLVQDKEDYLLVPISTAIGQFIVGVVSFFTALKYFNIKLKLIPFRRIYATLYKSMPVFLSYLAINLYTTANIIILGIFHSEVIVGLYSAASKAITISISLIMLPIGLSLFPLIGVKLKDNLQEGIALIRKALKFILVITSLISISMLLFAEQIIHLVFGPDYSDAVLYLKIMSPLPLIIGVSNVLGIQAMLNLKMDKQFLNITLQGSVLCLILNFLLVPNYGALGSTICWTLTELYITCGFYFILRKKNIYLI